MASQKEVLTNFAQDVFEASSSSENSPWQSYNLAPTSRTVKATRIYATEGLVSAPPQTKLSSVESVVLTGSTALVTLDFGVNTTGIVTLHFGPQSIPQTVMGVAFAESKQFVSRTSDRSMDFHVVDGALHITVPETAAPQSWTCPERQQRGAFRYLTVFLESDGRVELTDVRTYNNMNPSRGANLRNYSGYFYSDDDFLNTIWYAGAYTLQLATIPRNTGRRSDWVHHKIGWANDSPATTEQYQEVLTDGARRDRTVWSGDRNISTVSNFIALNNKEASWAGVDWMFELQTDDGLFPYACKPIWHYGIWTFIALYEAYFYHADGSRQADDWVRQKWNKIKKGMDFSLAKVDDTGLLKVTLPADWGRNLLTGHNLEVNCCLQHVLCHFAQLARDVAGDEALATAWADRSGQLKEAINARLWDDEAGLYRDYIDAPVHPQDGNSLALWYGVASPERAARVSEGLTANWSPFGPVAPESPKMVSPFCGSMELMGHYAAGRPDRALTLLRTMWGYIWNAPYAVQSSLIEGYYHDGRCFYPFGDYDSSYISHAHPWASGPTIALTSWLVGLRLLDVGHHHWIFAPQLVFDSTVDEGKNGQSGKSPLFAMTGFTSDAQGFFSAGYKRSSPEMLVLAIKAPRKTVGRVGLPTLGKTIARVEQDGIELSLDSLEKGHSHLFLKYVKGGNRMFIICYTE
ncbi:alpha-l-rhamnosidase [Grosmannia clavigera kw1407]|uniref:Alpha-l-rhamnosidase n=1 Tax=Grosmannia clavigera (strain kw1407 / UAMH 11150) TaxID=655863 RepID=F0XBD7_GROCL|nr:alpha-l-rhamnosidase [Grosmannia clavigera kw1407]EFX04866.1 alpha-l-rhamnosidase [Grosmannia clavigera kw1407]